jgi:hypothetical protein
MTTLPRGMAETSPARTDSGSGDARTIPDVAARVGMRRGAMIRMRGGPELTHEREPEGAAGQLGDDASGAADGAMPRRCRRTSARS